jgi:hypothetical protein
MLAYCGDGVVKETSDRQWIGNGTSVPVPIEGSRNMLFICHTFNEVWN